jgi:hypothetical protein
MTDAKKVTLSSSGRFIQPRSASCAVLLSTLAMLLVLAIPQYSLSQTTKKNAATPITALATRPQALIYEPSSGQMRLVPGIVVAQLPVPITSSVLPDVLEPQDTDEKLPEGPGGFGMLPEGTPGGKDEYKEFSDFWNASSSATQGVRFAQGVSGSKAGAGGAFSGSDAQQSTPNGASRHE